MSDTQTHSGPIDPQDLLRELDWLRRLAAGLVRDPAAADDAAQQTALAALQQPPSGARRPWLSRVARNFVRQDRRAASRRRRHEERQTVAAPMDDPALIAERAEAHRLIATLVTELPESARHAIVLRYYEDLRPAEIARRLGVPAGTVRARLHRALGELRAQLDARHRGGRRAWIAAIVPLLEEDRPAPTHAPASAAGTLLTIGASVVALGVLVIWAATRSETDPELVPRTDPPAQQTADVALPTVAHETTGTSTEAPERPPAPRTIVGRVVDASGAPVEGAQVHLRPRGTPDWSAPTLLPELVRCLQESASYGRQTVTDSDGTFSIAVQKDGPHELSASTPTAAAAAVPVDFTAADSITLELRRAVRVEGEVLDDRGLPVSDARVAFISPRTETPLHEVGKTDAAGRFSLLLANEPGSFRVRGFLVDHPEFAPAVVTYQRADPFLRVALSRGTVLAGRVLAPDGVPIAGARVRVVPRHSIDASMREPADVSTRTAKDGSFRLPRFGAAQRGRVTLIVDQTPEGVLVTARTFPRSTPLELRLPITVVTPIVVRTADGAVVPDVTLSVTCTIPATGSWLNSSQASSASVIDRAFQTDARGEVRLATPQGPRMHLRFASSDSRYALDARSRFRQAEAGETVELIVRPRTSNHGSTTANTSETGPPVVVISGVVLDQSGAPLPGARVSYYVQRPGKGHGVVWSDEDGRWTTRLEQAGPCAIQAFAAGHQPGMARVDSIDADTTFPEVRLRPAQPIRGVVVSDTGTPIPLVQVEMHQQGLESSHTLSDAAGRFSFDGFGPGAKAFVRRAPGHVGIARAVPVESDGTVRLTLTRAFVISGSVLTSTGAAFGDGTVVAVPASERGPRAEPVESFTDGDGNFHIDGLAAGSWDLYLMRSGAEHQRKAIAAGTTDLKWIVKMGVPITGLVANADGGGAAGVRVWAQRDDLAPGHPWARSVTTTVTDAEGRFSVPQSGVGTYAVWVDHPALCSAVLRGIAPGATGVRVRVSAVTQLTGQLRHPDGHAIGGLVRLAPKDGFGPVRPRVAASSQDGTFTPRSHLTATGRSS